MISSLNSGLLLLLPTLELRVGCGESNGVTSGRSTSLKALRTTLRLLSIWNCYVQSRETGSCAGAEEAL